MCEWLFVSLGSNTRAPRREGQRRPFQAAYAATGTRLLWPRWEPCPALPCLLGRRRRCCRPQKERPELATLAGHQGRRSCLGEAGWRLPWHLPGCHYGRRSCPEISMVTSFLLASLW